MLEPPAFAPRLLPENRVMQSLWVGDALGDMELLSIRSFLAHGHTYHLYLYDDCPNVPPGVIIKDAHAILPPTWRGYITLPSFADEFRYNLLPKSGIPWWVDLDIIALAPFNTEQPYCFASENYPPERPTTLVNTCVIKAPPDCAFLHHAIRRTATMDPAHPKGRYLNGIIAYGPELATELVFELALERFIAPAATFIPIASCDTPRAFIDPTIPTDLTHSLAVHCFKSCWGEGPQPSHHPNSLWEQLKRRYPSNMELSYA